MILNAAAFQTLMRRVPPTLMTKVNPPDFPPFHTDGALKPSSHNPDSGAGIVEVLSFIDEQKRFAIVIRKPQQLETTTTESSLHVIFYQRCLSNFTRIDIPHRTINGKELRELQCGEAFFKLYCAAYHLDKALTEGNKTLEASSIEAMEAVLSASKPADCKNATARIQGFDRKGWDDVSFNAMVATRMEVAADEDQHRFFKNIAALANAHKVPLDHIAFYEAAAANDLNWGTGLTVEQMHDMLLAETSDTVGTYFLPHGDELEKDRRRFAGGNKLGRALQVAFLFVIGVEGRFCDETLEDYRARLGSDLHLVTYEESEKELDGGATKRSRSASDADVSSSSSPAAVRQLPSPNSIIMVPADEDEEEPGEIVLARTYSCA